VDRVIRSSVRSPATPVGYYSDEAVRARVREFCGATGDGAFTAAYLTEFNPDAAPFPTWDTATSRAFAAGVPWSGGQDLARSLWDTAQLVFFLELDYQNVDRPDEPFRHPADAFLHLEPVYRAARLVLSRLRLAARTYVSGRGYHFIGTVRLDDPLVDELAGLVPGAPPWWHEHEARRPPAVTARLTERHARAAEGLGLLVEHAAHLTLRRARRASPMPVVFNGTVVGRGLNGRAAISIDFSHVGDPLDVRHVRTAFSTYQWHRYRPDIFGADVAVEVAPLAVVPRQQRTLLDLVANGRTLDAARETARGIRATLPDVGDGVGRLLESYRASALARFHRPYLDALWSTRGRPARAEPPPLLPDCARAALVSPNDLLLQPAHVQHLTRELLARGWNAARIAGLVLASYEADHGWGDRWRRLDAATRAAFDVRVFAGLVETGLDSLVDFNCVSAQEKGLCPRTQCGYNLLNDRRRLEKGRRA